MPLINQYFKNHCLYFLSTPAKVLGSGGHSSNKEKEMIARWALQLKRYNRQLWHVLYSFTISFFLTTRPQFLVLHFSFLSTSVSFVKCRLWWDTESLSLVRHQFPCDSFRSFLWLLYLMIWSVAQTDQTGLVLNASRGESCPSCRNWCLGNCKLPAHSGAVPGCKVRC